MKKIILSHLFILIFSLNIFVVDAATWKFEWSNTIVHVPVGSEIEEYRYIPYAVLYKDGQALSDANVTYLTEGDWLYFFKDVDSHVVGEYKVWYKAFENDKYCPGTCNGYKCLVTFLVEDKVPPTVEVINKEINIRRESCNEEELSLKLKDNVNCTDNYSSCEISFEHSIDISSIGRYCVNVVAIDDSKNISNVEFYVNIFDDRKPVITSSIEGNYLKVGLNESVDLSNYFTAYDIVEGDLTNKITYPSVYTDEEGVFEYKICVENGASLKDEYILYVEVVDDEMPVLVLSTHQLFLNYKDNFSEINFHKYILSLTDNVPIDYNNLHIKNDLCNKVGIYHIWYDYSDGIYTTSDLIEVRVVSKDKPVIEASDIIININDNVNLIDYINVVDESDENILQSVQIDDSNVNYDKEGTYYVSVYAVNSSGISNTKKIKIIISDNDSLSNLNIVFIIAICLLGTITLAFSIFFIYYFKLRKKNKNI